VIQFLSKKELGPGAVVTGLPHVRPPSVERIVRIALGEPNGVAPIPNTSVEIIQTLCSGS
jgi:hypothetical protein